MQSYVRAIAASSSFERTRGLAKRTKRPFAFPTPPPPTRSARGADAKRVVGMLRGASQLIFDTLYWVLAFGYTEEGGGENALDPPTDFFRIRMVATVLETCGSYFDRGVAKRKLDVFLVYFPRYLFTKSSLPMDVEFDVQDLLDLLRPKVSFRSSP